MIYPARLSKELLPEAVVYSFGSIDNSKCSVISMDNYDLSNLPLLGDTADSGEYNPRLTAEQGKQATFSGLSATVSTTEQAELQQLPSSGGEQISEQKRLAEFDLSLSPNIPDSLIADELLVGESQNPFAALAAYHPLRFDDDTGQPLDSNQSLFGVLNTSGAVLAEPEQSQGESDTAGFIIPESAISDTVSGKQRTSEPRSLIQESIGQHTHDSSSLRTDRLAVKRQKLDSKETELLAPPRKMVTRSESAVMPEKLAASRRYIERGRSVDKSLRDRVIKESDKWVARPGGVGEDFICTYPGCGYTCKKFCNLRTHIFNHIHISTYKCTYPECGDNTYFRNTSDLRRHVHSVHMDEKPYTCEICNKSFRRLDHYRTHVLRLHRIKL